MPISTNFSFCLLLFYLVLLFLTTMQVKGFEIIFTATEAIACAFTIIFKQIMEDLLALRIQFFFNSLWMMYHLLFTLNIFLLIFVFIIHTVAKSSIVWISTDWAYFKVFYRFASAQRIFCRRFKISLFLLVCWQGMWLGWPIWKSITILLFPWIVGRVGFTDFIYLPFLIYLFVFLTFQFIFACISRPS